MVGRQRLVPGLKLGLRYVAKVAKNLGNKTKGVTIVNQRGDGSEHSEAIPEYWMIKRRGNEVVLTREF